jgi:hypothetical protein
MNVNIKSQLKMPPTRGSSQFQRQLLKLTERRAVGVELGAGLMSSLCSVAVEVVLVSMRSLQWSLFACKKQFIVYSRVCQHITVTPMLSRLSKLTSIPSDVDGGVCPSSILPRGGLPLPSVLPILK